MRRITWLLLALCVAADLFVLRAGLARRALAPDQFRRGYFERHDGVVAIVADATLETGTLPTFILTAAGELGVPPGMTAVVTLDPGVTYRLASDDSARAPYVLIGTEAPVAPPAPEQPARAGDARLVSARTLSLDGDDLVLHPWDPARPWPDDAARLQALVAQCGGAGESLPVAVTHRDNVLSITAGRCSLREEMTASAPLLAAPAGPDWLTVTRTPAWRGERDGWWRVIAALVAKVGVTYAGVGLLSTVLLSLVPAAASIFVPMPASLTWLVGVVIGVGAAALRGGMRLLGGLPPSWRIPSALLVLAALAWILVPHFRSAPALRPLPSSSTVDPARTGVCTMLGYSTVKGEGLRREVGGIRADLNETCAQCRANTVGLFAGGERLTWVRDVYCAAAAELGAAGPVIFLGGANDDVLSDVFMVVRLVIAFQQGIEPWRRNQLAAAASSLANFDEQGKALTAFLACARSRHARAVFLHDFLVTDLIGGRDSDRATMLQRRRALVEAGGGVFVDLLERFRSEAGIAWFNDYVHPSLIAHERYAQLACGLSQAAGVHGQHAR